MVRIEHNIPQPQHDRKHYHYTITPTKQNSETISVCVCVCLCARARALEKLLFEYIPEHVDGDKFMALPRVIDTVDGTKNKILPSVTSITLNCWTSNLNDPTRRYAVQSSNKNR